MNLGGRSLQIQALRAVAAGLVLIYHAGWLKGGYIGVDIFYVISGFLITGLLLRELESSGSLRIRSFFARRAKRLLPASFLVIITTGVTSWFLFPESMRANIGEDVIAASAYLSNFLFAFWSNDYQNLGTTPSPLIHYWSLAVEEQFYLIWPFLILLFFKYGGRKGVLAGVSGVFISSFILSLYLTDNSPIWSFYLLPTRAWELAAGALLIFIPEVNLMKKTLASMAFIALLIGASQFDSLTPFPGTAAILPVFATTLLITSRDSWPRFINIVAKARITQWFGDISYPLYLWHWPVLIIPSIVLGRDISSGEKILLLSLTVILAGLTHQLIEIPMRSIKISDLKILARAGFLTIISVALGLAIIATHSNAINIQGDLSVSLDQIRVKPISNNDGCHINRGTTVSPTCEYGDLSSNRIIVLYGDSHAAQWLPTLDLIGVKRGLKIVSLTKSACPSAEVVKELSSEYDPEDCQLFRDSSIKRIQRTNPVAVIMTGLQPPTEPYSAKSARSWWLKGSSITLGRINAFTKYPIYISDTPKPQMDIPDCLSAARGAQCDTAKKSDPEIAPGFIGINPTPWLCNRRCPAVIDGVVVYRDGSHISVAMSKKLASVFEAELERIGLL